MSATVDAFREELRLAENSNGSGYSANTVAQYLRYVRRWEEWLDKPLAEATTRDVKLFLRELGEANSESLVTSVRTALSKYYQLCEDSNPVADLDWTWTDTTEKSKALPEDVEYLEPEEVQALIDNVPSSHRFRNELLIKILYYTGIRRSELITLRLQDVYLEQQRLSVWDEKGDERRVVGFRPELKTPLRLWIEEKRPVLKEADSEWLFPSPESIICECGEGHAFKSDCPKWRPNHIGGELVRRVVHQAAEDAGLQEKYGTDSEGRSLSKITPHTLRHSFAVQAAKNGVGAPFLKEQLGHHSLEVTQIYLQLAEVDAADKIGQMGPSLS